MLQIPRKYANHPQEIWHDPSECYKFLGNLGTIRATCPPVSLEYPQKPGKSANDAPKIPGIPRKMLQDPSKCYEFLGNMPIIHRKILHDPSKCYKLPGNLGTVQSTCSPVSPEYPQNPGKSANGAPHVLGIRRKIIAGSLKMLQIPRKYANHPLKIWHDPSECYKFLGNLGTMQHTCPPVSLEYPQKLGKSADDAPNVLGIRRKVLQDPSKCYKFLGNMRIIHRKIWHDPSECYKFLGNVATIRATCPPVSLEYPQNPGKSADDAHKIPGIPRKILQDPSKCYEFLGNVGIIHRKILHDPSKCYKLLGNLGTDRTLKKRQNRS